MESQDVNMQKDVIKERESTAEDNSNKDSPAMSLPSTSQAANNEVEVLYQIAADDNSSLASSSTNSLQFEDTVELIENLERDAVAAKYHTNLTVNSYSSLQDLHYDDSSTSTQSSSLSVFRELFEEDMRGSDSYYKACELYHELFESADSSVEEQFRKAENFLSNSYPNYWRYLLHEYHMNLDSDTYIKETVRKTMLIKSCKRLLEEEDRYSSTRPENIGSMRRIRFDGRLTYLNKDFKKACYLMREEYPLLFVYLVQTLEFMKFNNEKIRVEKSRKRVTELAKQHIDKLRNLDEKYKNMEEPKKH